MHSLHKILILLNQLFQSFFTDHNPCLFLFTLELILPQDNIKLQCYQQNSAFLVIHTEGNNLTVEDMLSRDFTVVTNNTCQVQQKTLPPHIEFFIITTKKLSKTSSLFSRTRRSSTNPKNDSHSIRVDYGNDQFTVRMQDKVKRLHLPT